MLISAHNSLLEAKDLLEFLPGLIKGDECLPNVKASSENNFVELGSSWRAPFYEMTICFQNPHGQDDAGSIIKQKIVRVLPRDHVYIIIGIYGA